MVKSLLTYRSFRRPVGRLERGAQTQRKPSESVLMEPEKRTLNTLVSISLSEVAQNLRRKLWRPPGAGLAKSTAKSTTKVQQRDL